MPRYLPAPYTIHLYDDPWLSIYVPGNRRFFVFNQLSVLAIRKTKFYACKWQMQIKGAKVSSLFASTWKFQTTREDKHQKTKNWM